MASRRWAVVFCWAACGAGMAPALDLVKGGRPAAEIVLAEDALPQVKLAARELRDHVRKMSGAELAIVARPGGRLHVWDADIAEACPFCVELDIDAAGTSVHTIYGVYREDAAQDARTVAAAAVAAGFRLLDWRTEAGQFALRFEK